MFLVLAAFASFIIYTWIVGDDFVNERKNRRAVVIGRTVKCEEPAKSSMSRLYYTFRFHNSIYSGSQFFSRAKRGDICEGFSFLVEFDSANPSNNLILLDSVMLNEGDSILK